MLKKNGMDHGKAIHIVPLGHFGEFREGFEKEIVKIISLTFH